MRKNATKIAAMALTLALTVTSVNLPSNTASAAAPKLNKKKATLYVGGYAKQTKKNTTTLKVTVNGKKKKATFTSNNKKVATVNKTSGKVTAKKKGTATITAKYKKKSYKCKITVKKFVNATTLKITAPTNAKKTLTVGKTTTIKQSVGPKNATVKGVTYKSSDTKVATVNSKGKVTAKKKGTAKITVATKGGKKKATVTITVKNAATPAPSSQPSSAPSGAPSTVPSGAPSTEPSGVPSTEPSSVPSETPSTSPSTAPSIAPGELGEMTSLTATRADQLTAVFSGAVPEDTVMSATANERALEGAWEWNTDRTSAVFTCKGNLPVGKVTVTATLGEKTVSKDVTVEESKVTEIKIKNEGEGMYALTGKAEGSDKDGTAAYIYYDVLDQYGTSIKESETIEWTVSPGTHEDNKSLGKLTVKKEDGFTYGNQIYVTGVHARTGVTKTAVVTVGMSQEVDTLEFVGFVNKNDLSKLIPLTGLPKDFAKETYWLLYKSFDQNGNPLEMDVEDNRGKNLTFLSDAPMLVDNPTRLDPDNVVTVAGEQYGGVQIEPGMYVDRGGEVNITAISNRTGKKTVVNLVIGEGGLLKSLVLKQPAIKVANGDKGVEIPYEATDTKGEKITNYETIARSTHELKLTAAESTTLKLYEKSDGTAGVIWFDKDLEKDGKNWYTDSAAANGVDRNVALTSVVVGGESNNLILTVSDTRRPNAITGVKVDDTNSEYLVSGKKIVVNPDNMTFKDQYGYELSSENAKAFFKNTAENKLGDTDYYYGIKMDVAGNATEAAVLLDENGDDKIQDQIRTANKNNNDEYFEFTAWAINTEPSASPEASKQPERTVETESVKYSIVRCKGQPNANGEPENEVIKDYKWDAVGKSFSTTYSIIPVTKVKNPEITGVPSKVQLEDQMDENQDSSKGQVANGEITVGVNDNFKANLAIKNPTPISVIGKYNGQNVSIPKEYWKTASDSSINIGDDTTNSLSGYWGRIYSVSAGAITWGDLYDYNTTLRNRKDTTKTLRVAVNNTGDPGNPTVIQSDVLLSDAPSYPTTIQYYVGGKAVSEATLDPKRTGLGLQNKTDPDNKLTIKVNESNGSTSNVEVKNYGKVLTKEEALGIGKQPADYGVLVLDQYGNAMTNEHLVNKKNLAVEYKIFDIEENTGSLAHKSDSCATTSNGTDKVTAEGLEIGDTFRLKLSVKDAGVSTVVKVTVGADEFANVTNGATPTDDETLRKNHLGYDR